MARIVASADLVGNVLQSILEACFGIVDAHLVDQFVLLGFFAGREDEPFVKSMIDCCGAKFGNRSRPAMPTYDAATGLRFNQSTNCFDDLTRNIQWRRMIGC